MAQDATNQAAGFQSSQEFSEPRPSTTLPKRASPVTGPVPQHFLPDGTAGSDSLLREANGEREPSKDTPRRSLARRHPIALPIAMAVLALVAASGYLDWDDARHFQTTDDAFIAARRFAVAPE